MEGESFLGREFLSDSVQRIVQRWVVIVEIPMKKISPAAYKQAR
jgi:hypothetical protein